MKAWRRDCPLYLMALPAVLFYIIFCYVPMPGLVVSFKEYIPGSGMFSGEWVGLRWFDEFFRSPFAWRTIRNTFLLAFYTLLFSFPIPIIFAVVVTEIRNMKIRRIVQTVSYIPYFVSTVVMVGMLKSFLDMRTGILTQLIVALGGQPHDYMGDANSFRFLYVATDIWQHFGFNSIIYIAAIVGIDPTLYEASKLDGIKKFQEVWYITIPMIRDTIVILFILALGSLMSVGFEKVYMMYSPATYATADVISTYVYRKGIESHNLGYATAVGMFNSVINFIFVFIANTMCRRVSNASLW